MTPLQQKLIDAGYTKYVSDSYKAYHHTDTLFQKRVVDHKGKKYFIDIWWLDLSQIVSVEQDETLGAEVQYTLKDGEKMNVISFYKDIDQIELQFEEIWTKLGCGYYESWEES